MVKRILLFCGAMMLATASFAQTTIYAFRDWQANKPTDYVAGPAKFRSDKPGEVTLLQDQTNLGRSYAGLYYNYKWFILGVKPGTQSQPEGIYEIDMTTGARKLHAPASTALVEMTYDYSSGTVYGIGSDKKLKTIDLNTGKATTIGMPVSEVEGEDIEIAILALACDLDGKLYGIATNDFLFEIDKKTARCTSIGSTMVNASQFQSMEFDHNNHELYWANNGDYTLYTVDLKTGKATKIGYLGETMTNDAGVEMGSDSFSGMSIPYIHVSKGAPDRVTERKAVGDATKVTLSWKYPAIDAQGKALEGLTKAHIYRDGKELTTITLTNDNIGAAATYVDENPTAGLHSYGIVCENAQGLGGRETDDVSTYVGDNAPGAVEGLKAVAGDNSATLSWSRPTKGMYDGAFDPESISGYAVYRISGTQKTKITTVTTTEYTDKPSTFGTYSYAVAAINDMGEGVLSTTDPLMVKPADWLVMRNAKETIKDGVTYRFYDSGGPNGYYKNAEDYTLTLVPENKDAIVRVQFKSFTIDYFGDILSAYNGTDTKAPLIGQFATEALDAAMLDIRGTNADGALTFKWASDVMSTDAGWTADVSTIVLKQKDLEATSLKGNKMPVAGKDIAYNVVVRNFGTTATDGSDYSVQIVDAASKKVLGEADGVALSRLQSATVAVNCQFAEAGKSEIYAEVVTDGDEDAANNKTANQTVIVLSESGKQVRIGNNEPQLAVLPSSFMAVSSLSEQLYRASEIGVSDGKIQALGFPMEATKSYTPNVKIWIAETEPDTLSKEGIVAAGDMQLVFDGTQPVVAGDDLWLFCFDKPFNYTGKNLLVLVYKTGDNTNGDGVNFCGTYNSGALRSAFRNYGEIDPSKPIASSPGRHLADAVWAFDSPSAGVSEPAKDATITVYPNPTTGNVYVKSADSVERIEVYSMSGVKVKSVANASSLDIANLPAGQYIVKAVTAGKATTKMIVKK